MFYCKPCQEANTWPESMFRSAGRCEACGSSPVQCFEVPSSKLPPPSDQFRWTPAPEEGVAQ